MLTISCILLSTILLVNVKIYFCILIFIKIYDDNCFFAEKGCIINFSLILLSKFIVIFKRKKI